MKYLIIVFISQIIGCASSQMLIFKDSCKIMTITSTTNWYDDTEEYLVAINRLRKYRKSNTGIKFLFSISRFEDNTSNDVIPTHSNCNFRELRYLENEEGYKWDISKLANEVALVFNETIQSYSTMDYVKIGIDVPLVGIEPIKSSQLALSSAIKLNGNNAWQVTYQHYLDKMNANYEFKTLTVVLKSSTEAENDEKFYIVGECSLLGEKYNITKIEKEIYSMLDSIRLSIN